MVYMNQIGNRWFRQLTQSPDGVMWAGADKQALDAIFKEVGRKAKAPSQVIG